MGIHSPFKEPIPSEFHSLTKQRSKCFGFEGFGDSSRQQLSSRRLLKRGSRGLSRDVIRLYGVWCGECIEFRGCGRMGDQKDKNMEHDMGIRLLYSITRTMHRGNEAA